MGEHAFGKEARLLDPSAYKRVFDRVDAKVPHRHLLLLARKNGLEHHRLGLVISKQQVRGAVQRNRIKRVVREFFRQRPPGGVPMDVIVLARGGMDRLDNATLSTLLRQQWRKLTKH